MVYRRSPLPIISVTVLLECIKFISCVTFFHLTNCVIFDLYYPQNYTLIDRTVTETISEDLPYTGEIYFCIYIISANIQDY